MADHADPAKRTEWIDVQIAVDMPISINGALLRAEVLAKARDILDSLQTHYERVGQQSRQR